MDFNNLGELVFDFCKEFNDLTAFSQNHSKISYGEVLDHSLYFASFLEQQGFLKGERLAIMMPNLLPYPIALYGCFFSGVIAVNINPLYTARELLIQLKDCQPKGIIISENFAHILAGIIKELPFIENIIIVELGDEHFLGEKLLVRFIAKYIRKLIPKYNLKKENIKINTYSQSLELGEKTTLSNRVITKQDIAMLQYTGGTTGEPKGALLSHGNLLANFSQVKEFLGTALDKSGMVNIVPLPLYHIFCCTVNGLILPAFGMNNVLIANPRDFKGFIKVLKKRPFSVLTGVNTLFECLMNEKGFADLNFRRLKFVVAGGMSLDAKTSERWRQITGNVIIEGYGLTETSPVLCINPIFSRAYSGTVGRALKNTQLKICDEAGNALPIGRSGELWVKGPQVMQGYWQREEETKEVLTADGWLKTGDIAVIDNQGFVKIIGRKKDLIIVSGFNVYPSEVEEVLKMHPDVVEAAVIGVKSERHGEIVKAFIEKKPSSNLTIRSLKSLAKANLTNYKRPKIYEFIEKMPRSNLGKVLKRELRDKN